MLAQQKRKWQTHNIYRHRDNGFHHVAHAKRRHFWLHRAPKQRSLQQEGSLPSNGRNHFIDHCFIAPDKYTSLIHHFSQEILILSRTKLRIKCLRTSVEQFAFNQQISAAPLAPRKNISRLILRAFVEPALRHPSWRRLIEMPLDWPENSINLVLHTGLEQIQQPLRRRKLVIVNEGDKVTRGVLDCLISRQCNTLPRFYTILDRHAG